MAKDVCSIFRHCGCSRISSIATSLCILCTFPHQGFGIECGSSDEMGRVILSCVTTGDEILLTKRFDDLEKIFDSSENPFQESHVFLTSLIDQINTQYGMNLTIRDACVLLRQNMNTLQLTPDAQDILLDTIDWLESGNVFVEKPHKMISNSCYWPWKWNWFGLNKKKHRYKESIRTSNINPYLLEEDLPGNIYVGGVEIFAAGLCFILGFFAFPPAHAVGAYLVGDGFSRILNGCDELDKQRENYPSQPLSVN